MKKVILKKSKLSWWKSYAFLAASLFAAIMLETYPASAATPSINGSSIPTVSSLTDGSGDVWTVSGGIIDKNGQKAGMSANVIYLLYLNNTIYQENAAKGFWSWNGSTWVGTSDPRTVSANGATSSGSTPLIDSEKNVWVVSSGVIYENGQKAGYSANVIDLTYSGGTIYQENSSDNFWDWNGTTWVASGSPGGSGGPNPTPSPVRAPAGVMGVRVSGNHLIDQNGDLLQLRGVNVSALEGYSIKGQSDPWGGNYPTWTVIGTGAGSNSWHANAVRLPMNEASWLGYSCSGGTSSPSISANYQATVKAAVADANAAGLYVILDLHEAAPSPYCPTIEARLPDAEHAIPFWSSVANTFKGNPAVIFELYNEPVGPSQNTQSVAPASDWYMLLHGGYLTGFSQNTIAGTNINITFETAGMQAMLNAVRGTGATNVVLAAGLEFNSTLNDWLSYTPNDPIHQLAASWHPYFAYEVNNNAGYAQAILNAPYPIVITETGDAFGPNSGTYSPNVQAVTKFSDPRNISYLVWTWDPGWISPGSSGYFQCVYNENGTPTGGEGMYFKAHLLCRAAGNQSCP